MKIIYLHQHFRTPLMKGGTRSYEMARRWVAQGHDVHVVTSDSDRAGRGWRTYEVSGVVVHAYAVRYQNSMSFRRRIAAFGHFAGIAAIRARKLKADVVFATSTPLTIILPALVATCLRRTPIVFEVRDLWPDLPIAVGAIRNPLAKTAARWLETIAYRSSRKIIALSPGMADGIMTRNIAPGKIVVAPNSCDLDEFDIPGAVGADYRRREPWLGTRPLVVYCGTLGRMNDVRYLVDVASAMKELDPDVAFAVFGDGAEEGAVRDAARSRNLLEKNFFMPGTVVKKEIPAVLSAATVCTSLFLPLGEMEANSANKFFDALAAGRPLAINYGGWQAELLRSTGAGLVLPTNNPPLAAAELHAFIRDDVRLSQARAAARRLARDEFARDLISDRVLQAVSEADAEPRIRARRTPSIRAFR